MLVTGCSGLIGSALTALLKQGANMNVTGTSHSAAPAPGIIHLDLNEPWNDAMLPAKTDVVIHLAQSEKFRDFPASAREVFEINTHSTLKLLDYARKAGVKKFIYASSGGVYGNSDTGFNEESPLQPNKDLGFYLTTKFCSELLVENYTAFFDINILRFFFVFGEKQRRNMLMPRLIESVKTKKPITLQGKEGIKINPVYVEDAARTIVKIIETPGSYNVNIGGAETVSIKQLSELIGTQLNMSPVFEHQDTEVKNLIGDISKMKQLYSPVVSLEEAIKKLI
ncbi:MAG: NAD-dependent epimerase/dehydratase family protein [Bacteroidia bacterium]